MATLSPEEEAQREDEQALTKNAGEIKDVLDLLRDGHTRDSAMVAVADLEHRIASQPKNARLFHDHAAAKIPLRARTALRLQLVAALEVLRRTHRHGTDLHKALAALVRHRRDVLRRVIAREAGGLAK